MKSLLLIKAKDKIIWEVGNITFVQKNMTSVLA